MEEFMAACDIKLQPSHAEDPSCPKVICIEEQPTKETLPSPLAYPPGQQLTKTIATPKTNPTAHSLPKPTATPQIDLAIQSLPKTTAPPPCKDPEPITAQPQDPPPPSPPKIPPSSPIDEPRNQPHCQLQKPQSPATPTLCPNSSTQHSPYLKTTHHRPQTKLTKPKKPPPLLKPNLFHNDWSRKRKRARLKSSNFMKRRKPLAVFEFGRGKKDTGWDKRGPKKKRQVRRANNRGFKFKVSAIRCSARKRLGKETRSWLRVAGTGQRQGAGLRRMGSDPEDPTERGSPPNGVSGHRRPPRRPPDGDYAKGGDSGLNHGSPEFSIEHRGELPRDFVMDAEITADDRQFPVSKVDRGACSGLTGGGRLKIGPEISGFFAAVEFNPESARGKWKEVAAGREGTHVRAAGGVKSGHLVERKYGARSCYP